jgi:hypothetical protein
MRRYLNALLMVAAVPCLATAQDPFDGIAATVNGEIISIAEVRRAAVLAREDTLGLGSLCEGQSALAAELAQEAVPSPIRPSAASAPPTTAELERARECLIDTRLVFREVRRFPRITASEADLDAMIAALVEEFGTPAALAAELHRAGLTEAEIRDDLRRQILVAEYIDGRFLATVDITDEEARAEWEREFVPTMEAEGVPVPSFESVAADYLVPILQQREVNRRVQSWIFDLRARATIRRMYP